ncbi:hypothetical protein Nepgr_021214 [Nepenthes gracilis]|uniref:Adenine DNA glycosylase n=1 Tax=Nepenthes gracilis TaxID=150966 RepID=A0AAD3SXR6_NEPGR|nr:hypothetical protein Nepgr_021214 [Nepenthes gracilis]
MSKKLPSIIAFVLPPPGYTPPTNFSMSKATTKRRKNFKEPTPAASVMAPIAGKRTRVRKIRKPHDSENGRGAEDIEDLLRFNGDDIAVMRVSLLDWYDQNRRDLPWRRLASDSSFRCEEKGSSEGKDFVNEDEERRVYGIWVSEMILQQTRVAATVITTTTGGWINGPPFIIFLWLLLREQKRLPRKEAASPERSLLSGRFLGLAVPVVDGNVVRVLSRLKTISANPKDSSMVKNFWELAEQLVDPCRPGDFNQAIMELGATICTPTGPNCSSCPVSGQCHALSISQTCSQLLVTDYPQKVTKAKQRHEFSAVCVVEISESLDFLEGHFSNGCFLLVKRPDEGLLAGLWEFPSVLLDQDSNAATRRKTIDHFLKKTFNLDSRKTSSVILREEVGEYVHIFSHIRLKMYVELLILHLKGGMKLVSEMPDDGTIVWKCVESKGLSRMGLTSGVRKVYCMIQSFKQNISASNLVLQR